MATYRFVGYHSEIGDAKLTKFGQAIDLKDDLAREVIGTHLSGGVAILPEEEFAGIGFTEQELSLYSNPTSHGHANESFQLKKKKALLAAHDLRSRAEAGGPLRMPASGVAEAEAKD